MDSKRELLRHTLATLAYRAARALDRAPESFASFDGGGRTPVEILAHMGDLFDWALSMAEGEQRWSKAEPLAWTRRRNDSSRRSGRLTRIWPQTNRCMRRLSGCFKGQWPTL